MSVNMLLHNALSGLHTNQSALTHVSNNIANVNTPDYARRIVHQEAVALEGQGAGVGIAEVRRAVDTFFTQQSIEAKGDAGRYEAESRIHERLQALFGRPDDPNGLPQRINTALSAVADVLIDPSSPLRRSAYLSEVLLMTQGFTDLAHQLQVIRADVNNEIAGQVNAANRLIERIDSLNQDIQRQVFEGNDTTALAAQRDAALAELGGYLDIRTQDKGDGTLAVATGNGFPLVGAGRATLSYSSTGTVTAETAFPQIEVVRVTSTGTTFQNTEILDSHISGGSIHGLMVMRDRELPDLAGQIGELAGVITDRLNAAHNDSIAVPPPTSLTGRSTGLIATDALNFSGRTTLALTDPSGALAGRIDIDFDAGTLSVNGGAPTAFAANIAAYTTGLDVALQSVTGGTGSVTFGNGALALTSGTSGFGLGFLEDGTTPSARAGRGFSHFFGLNDLVRGHQPAHVETGLSPADSHGFTAGETMDLELRGSDGGILRSMTLTIGGTAFSDILTQLNDPTTGLGGALTFSLDANGKLVTTPAAGFQDSQLQVTADNTARVPSGISLSDLFGIGGGKQAERARELAVLPGIAGDPTRLALAKLDIDGATVMGDIVTSPGDNRGAQALQAIVSANVAFDAAGSASATVGTIANYSGTLLGDAASRAALAEQRSVTATALDAEVTARKTEVQGVNLDEELSNMIIYQQAYNASARMMTTAQQLYDQLLQLV